MVIEWQNVDDHQQNDAHGTVVFYPDPQRYASGVLRIVPLSAIPLDIPHVSGQVLAHLHGQDLTRYTGQMDTTHYLQPQHPALPVTAFEQELCQLLNRYSKESSSDTPDFILAEYLVVCLEAFNMASNRREAWWGQEGAAAIDFASDCQYTPME
jgi:hypothetical protein